MYRETKKSAKSSQTVEKAVPSEALKGPAPKGSRAVEKAKSSHDLKGPTKGSKKVEKAKSTQDLKGSTSKDLKVFGKSGPSQDTKSSPSIVVEKAESSEDLKGPTVYLDISKDEVFQGRITIQLFPSVAPEAAERFRRRCTGEVGRSVYEGSAFMILEWGIIGGERRRPHNCEMERTNLKRERGAIATWRTGENLVDADKFEILTADSPVVENTVFGRVIEGLEVVDHIISTCELTNDGEFSYRYTRVTIQRCGQLTPGPQIK